MNNDDLFLQAAEAFRLKKFAEAEKQCQEILSRDSQHALALFLSGMLRAEQGHLKEALPFLERACLANPTQSSFLHYYGNIQLQLQQPKQACHNFLQALQLSPQDGTLWMDLANAQLAEQQFAHAQQSLLKATQFITPNAHWHGLMARLTQHLDLPPAERDLQVQHHFHSALKLDPQHHATRCNLGNWLRQRGQKTEAEQCYQHILTSHPSHPEALYNLARLYFESDRLEESLTIYRQLVHHHPHHVDGWNSLGSTLDHLGQSEEALQCFTLAAKITPDDPIIRWNRALALLRLEKWSEGWAEYEIRKEIPRIFPPRPWPAPFWQGEVLHNQSILVVTEQGLGDAIHFSRYLPLLQERGAHIIVECQPELMRLLQTLPCIEQVIPRGAALPQVDWVVPLLSLPHFLSPTALPPSAFPSWSPPKFQKRIGLAWQGNPEHQFDRWRSCPITVLTPLLKTQGIAWISLQKNAVEPWPSHLAPLLDTTAIQNCLDLADTVDLLKSLDLVITIDSAVAHLAASFALPTWLMISAASDWRWGRVRTDSPWYPSLRLYRQNKLGNWSELISKIIENLTILLKQTDDCQH